MEYQSKGLHTFSYPFFFVMASITHKGFCENDELAHPVEGWLEEKSPGISHPGDTLLVIRR